MESTANRKQLSREAEEVNRLIGLAVNPLFALSDDATIAFYNPAFYRLVREASDGKLEVPTLFGLPLAEVPGLSELSHVLFQELPTPYRLKHWLVSAERFSATSESWLLVALEPDSSTVEDQRVGPIKEQLDSSFSMFEVVESANDAIIVTSADLDEPGPIIEYVNPAFTRMSLWEPDEIIGKSPRVLQGPKTDRQIMNALKKGLATDLFFETQTINYRKDGSEYSVEWRIFPLKTKDGEISHWAAIQRDITERIAKEQQLEQARTQLEERVAERTVSLTNANSELEGFIYTVSHDLRAPLRAIMGSSMILLEDYSDKIDQDGKDLLARQSVNAKKLGLLIDELLKLSRLNREQMVKTDLDFSALAAEVTAEIRRRPETRPSEVIIQPGMHVEGDQRLLSLALQNLIENSMKFVKQGEEAKIEIGQDTQNGKQCFFVRDHGIGFKTEYAKKIFLPFERLVREEDFAGTGIGLANVKRIINRHDGEIWAESEEGKGTSIYFTL